jgi:predicted phage terminase large subunit-like protein
MSEDDENETFYPVETRMVQHHKLILNKLDQISKTRHGRMMIFCPPGSAKSTYASVVFTSFFLGKNPGSRIISASYGDDLARKMGRRTRSIIRQDRFKSLFNTQLSSDSQAANEFSLTNGSEYMACGLMAGVTGNRANGIVIDDPIRGREQANSETIRNKTWDAYEDDLKTRLVPGGWIVLILTRWHVDDPAGRILPDGWQGQSGPILCKDGNTWEVLCLQARCEVANDPLGREFGETLWPEWFDPGHWRQFESNQRTWNALYQQLPTIIGGEIIKGEWFNYYSILPQIEYRVIYADTAQKTKERNDYSVFECWGKGVDGRLYLIDLIRGKWEMPELERKAVQFWNKHKDKTDKWATGFLRSMKIEDKASGTGLIQKIKSQNRIPVLGIERNIDKYTRVTDIVGFIQSGFVYIPENEPWVSDFINECESFTADDSHQWDDQIDPMCDAIKDMLMKTAVSNVTTIPKHEQAVSAW